MKKELIIFGAFGALGKGVTEFMKKKDYHHIYLFDYIIPVEEKGSNKISLFATGDLSHEKNIENAFKVIKPVDDKLYFLFSTIGGFFGGKSIAQTEKDDWLKMLNMNLNINFLIAKHFSKVIEKTVAGSICFTSARTSQFPEANKAAYGTSKAALNYLVKTLAIEGEKINLSVNALAPLIIDTPENRKWMPEENSDLWGKPEEIGNFLHNLFNNFHYISGNVILLSKRFQIKQVNSKK